MRGNRTPEHIALNRTLLKPFVDGEQVEIHRTLSTGERVIIYALASEASSLSTHKMRLTADVKLWGISPYADGRVARQRESIDRLQKRLEEARELIQLATWGSNEVQERAERWLRHQEGEGNNGQEADEQAAGQSSGDGD